MSIAESGENGKGHFVSEGTTSGESRFRLAGLRLDRRSRTPLYLQIRDSIRAAICNGYLQKDALLPSTRALANRLRVSRNTVVQAYEELVAAGFIDSRHGSGTRVRSGALAPAVLDWRTLLNGSGCPGRSVACGDPDGTSLYVFAAAGKR